MAGKNENRNELEQSELAEFECLLRQKKPLPLTVPSEQIMFESGRQIGLQQANQLSELRTPSKGKLAIWQLATAAMFILSIVSLGGWLNQASINSTNDKLIAANNKIDQPDNPNSQMHELANDIFANNQQGNRFESTPAQALSTVNPIAKWLARRSRQPKVNSGFLFHENGSFELLSVENVDLVIAAPISSNELLDELMKSETF